MKTETCPECYALIPSESSALHEEWHIDLDWAIQDLRDELSPPAP